MYWLYGILIGAFISFSYTNNSPQWLFIGAGILFYLIVIVGHHPYNMENDEED